jgi:GNAT superfamily N-acetyltransferase
MQLITLNNSNLNKLQFFLETAGNSLQTFRYFNKRPLTIIENHLVTYLLLDELDNPVCYGHLDKEDGIIWLGISTTEKCKGKGYGKAMMHHLIEFAKAHNHESIYLSVDTINLNAIRLYEKFGFIHSRSHGTISFFKLTL